ncbi:hypothetical protein SAMN06265222_1531, partial [Neorhodopirellula lusitana]
MGIVPNGYARGRSGNQFKSTHSLQVHRADNESMHRSRCVSAPVVAFGILPPPLRHPCPVMLGDYEVRGLTRGVWPLLVTFSTSVILLFSSCGL